jgi:hypothetical protein
MKQNGQQSAVEAHPAPSKRKWSAAYSKIETARQKAPLADDHFYRPDESDRLQRAKRWIAKARGEA